MNLEYLLLALPAIVFFLMFRYLPMAGAVLAFKNYQYNLGTVAIPIESCPSSPVPVAGFAVDALVPTNTQKQPRS